MPNPVGKAIKKKTTQQTTGSCSSTARFAMLFIFFLPIPPQQHVGNTLRGAGTRLLEDVGIEVQSRTGGSMSKPTGNGEDIRSAVDKDAGCRMTKGVGLI